MTWAPAGVSPVIMVICTRVAVVIDQSPGNRLPLGLGRFTLRPELVNRPLRSRNYSDSSRIPGLPCREKSARKLLGPA